MTRGYFSIGIYEPIHEANEGILMRAAFLFGASSVFTIGAKYTRMATDTPDTAKQIPLYEYKNFHDFMNSFPKGASLIGVEQDSSAKKLHEFKHPEQAVYLLGSERAGLPIQIMASCNHLIEIDTPKPYSMNVAMAGTLVMNDRNVKGMKC